MTRPARLALFVACLAPALLLLARSPEPQGPDASRATPLVPSSPPSDPVVAAILKEGKDNSRVMNYLRYITHNIGARPTGSPALAKGEKWAAGQFKAMGCDNVVLEHWEDVPGFQRGPRQSGRMISPIPSTFQFSTNVWTQGTNGPVRGRAIKNPNSLDEAKQIAKDLKGAWVLMPYKPNMRGPINRDSKELKEFVDSCGIAGRIWSSNSELIHTHGTYKWRDGDKTINKTAERHPRDVEIVVRKSDMERIQRWTAQEPTTLEFDIENRWLKPIPQHNVIADIRGTEKPDEMIIIGGHFDSWDSPGSQGANDNGTGSAVALEAARILKAVKAKPKRTIRFILWSGEEQGLLGSRSYVEKHKEEMDKISAVFVDDGGTGYHAGYLLTQDMVPLMSAAVAPVNFTFPDMTSQLHVTPKFAQEEGSDHASFLRYAVPAFATEEGGDADYFFIWHTQNDTLEQSVPKYLVQSATEAAAVAYSLANADSLLPRTKKPAADAAK
jgi:carboxypeptidase Q